MDFQYYKPNELIDLAGRRANQKILLAEIIYLTPTQFYPFARTERHHIYKRIWESVPFLRQNVWWMKTGNFERAQASY